MLGLAMVPGRHIVSLSVDDRTINQRHQLPQHKLDDRQASDPLALSLAGGLKQLPTLEHQFTAPQTKELDPPSGYT